MCGYSGAIYTSSSKFAANSKLKENFYSQASKLKHRGNEPMRKLECENLLLAHFRLAFQDIAANIQPMLSKNNKWVIVFNGEIYNHGILRKKIIAEQGYKFATKSDTETILEGFLNYGLEIKKYIEGEYSFVICKTDGTEIIAMRDPFGVKPLFLALEDVQTQVFAIAKESYLIKTKSIQFASEIKGLAMEKKWDREGFLKQFVGLYEPIRTPFQNIIQLPPNAILYAKKQDDSFTAKIQLTKVPIRSGGIENELNQNELYGEFSKSLQKSVEHRMISEIELGIYLSGGIDSKAVAYEAVQYYLKKKPKQNIKSFTISFQHDEYSESTEALSFAKKMGIIPNIWRISDDNLSYAYKHAVYYSENVQPYTNGAGKWWLSRFTGKHVRGVLTGDGADELFCGYPSFRYASWWKFALHSRPEKNVFDKIKSLPIGNNWRDSVYLKKFSANEKDPWLAGSSAEGSGDDFIESLKIWGVPHPLFGQISTIACAILGQDEGMKWLNEQKESVSSWFSFGLSQDPEFLTDPNNSILLWQNYFCKTHLPVQVLNWVGDRMEMANTVEGRTPYLSKEMAHIAAKIKDNMLIRGFEDKSILRRSYQKKLGQNFAMTPKKQFGAPFLFNENLLKNYQKQIILKSNETQLFDSKFATNLFEFIKNDLQKKKATSHNLVHLNAAIQTLICFSHVDDSIVKGMIPERDLEFEEKVIRNQKII
jgi:asparagine synthase (glutamine-hydrolysing)